LTCRAIGLIRLPGNDSGRVAVQPRYGVQIVRFDPEVALPFREFGSDFRIGPLTGRDSLVRVQIVYLAGGGLIGCHPTSVKQLLAVVAGRGWVAGQGGTRRSIRAGYGAVWEVGEDHEAGSDEGLTALCVEGDFDVWATIVTREIVVSDYDEQWPAWFEQVRAAVWPAIADLALRIDHVGSTAVPGLAAKSIIDMDIVVASPDHVRPVVERLATIGYRWRGDLGVAGREAFSPDRSGDLPAHHLYLVVENNRAHLDHWLLRDLLRSDRDARARYAALKRANADMAGDDMDVYVAAKAALVADLLTRARAERGFPPVTYWDPTESV
jgi:GrpB-like predicted nucleotidyltransferase (UPF0157 family)